MTKKQKAKDAQPASEETSHVLGIISSLFTHIASESVERIRLLTKFVEKNYEKVDKLLDIRDAAKSRLKATEKQIDTEKQELLASGEEIDQDQESLWYLSRLDGGLFTLQTVDYILAWIIMEDDGVRLAYCMVSQTLLTVISDSNPRASDAETQKRRPR